MSHPFVALKDFKCQLPRWDTKMAAEDLISQHAPALLRFQSHLFMVVPALYGLFKLCIFIIFYADLCFDSSDVLVRFWVLILPALLCS